MTNNKKLIEKLNSYAFTPGLKPSATEQEIIAKWLGISVQEEKGN